MINTVFFSFGSIPAILYTKATLRKLYENCVTFGMTLTELRETLSINPSLTDMSDEDAENLIEIFEYENEEPEKYVMVFINGKLDKWYTELKKSLL